jgi:chemotaxis protein MotB
MARRPKPTEHANHERWLVSYADFITLLFAFFVVMFASTQTDHKRAQQISDSVKKALDENRVAAAVEAVLGGTVNDKGKGSAMLRGPGGVAKGDKDNPTTQPVNETPPAPPVPLEPPSVVNLSPALQVLTHQLKAEIDSGSIQVKMETRGLVISFKQAANFASGGEELTDAAYRSISKVSDTLRKIPNPIRLEGHTDSLPINTSRFHNNWELSAARSVAMIEVLSSKFQINRYRMSIGGYADVAPIDTNDTVAGRARNRRVDLVILSEVGLAAEPNAPVARSAAGAAGEQSSAPKKTSPRRRPSPTDPAAGR